MRRILHVIDSLGRTSSATQLLMLAPALAARGFDVQVVSLDSGGTLGGDFCAAGIPVTELGRRWPVDPLAFVRFERLLFRFRPDVVHTWDFDAGFHGRTAARMSGVRRLIASHNRVIPSTARLNWFLARGLAPITERLIVGGEFQKEWSIQHGLPEEKIVVIRPGAPPAQQSDVTRDELLRQLQLPADARLIGVVGSLVPENRVKDLIWAADLLRVLHDNLRLLVIGDGPLRPQLTEYARLASDLDHIQFLGERHDAWRIMPHLDVLWNASENVSVSVSILEAMAAGVPVIASDTPINRELVVENETGYLIPLGTRAGRAARARHTDRVFADANLPARLSQSARQRATEQFSAKRSLDNYLDAYAKLPF